MSARKALVIYHNADLDGFCSATLSKMHLEFSGFDEVVLRGWDHGQPIPEYKDFTDEVVFMVDISLPAEDMIHIYNMTEEFHWFDHHVSAIKLSKENGYDAAQGVREIGISATGIVRREFFGNAISEVLDYVDRYDVFRDSDKPDWDDVLEVQYGMRHWIKDPAIGVDQYDLNSTMIQENYVNPNIRNAGKTIFNFISSQNRELVKNAFPLRIGSYEFLAVNGFRGGSTTFKSMGGELADYDGLCTFYYTGRRWKFSIYGNGKDIDMSVLAKQMSCNGGGHFGAAGFEVKDISSVFKTELYCAALDFISKVDRSEDSYAKFKIALRMVD